MVWLIESNRAWLGGKKNILKSIQKNRKESEGEREGLWLETIFFSSVGIHGFYQIEIIILQRKQIKENCSKGEYVNSLFIIA